MFLPRVEERELPWRLARQAGEVEEERRLLYVGMTRARLHLTITWGAKPSRFLEELGIAAKPTRRPPQDHGDLPAAFAPLRKWRLERAKADGVPAFVVFHDSTLAEIARQAPQSLPSWRRSRAWDPRSSIATGKRSSSDWG